MRYGCQFYGLDRGPLNGIASISSVDDIWWRVWVWRNCLIWNLDQKSGQMAGKREWLQGNARANIGTPFRYGSYTIVSGCPSQTDLWEGHCSHGTHCENWCPGRGPRLMSRLSRQNFGMSRLSRPKLSMSRIWRPKPGISRLLRPWWTVATIATETEVARPKHRDSHMVCPASRDQESPFPDFRDRKTRARLSRPRRIRRDLRLSKRRDRRDQT